MNWSSGKWVPGPNVFFVVCCNFLFLSCWYIDNTLPCNVHRDAVKKAEGPHWFCVLTFGLLSTYCGRDRMATIVQTTYWWYPAKRALSAMRKRGGMGPLAGYPRYSSTFSWMEIFVFRYKFHWRLLIRFHFIMTHTRFGWWIGATEANYYLD